MDCYNVPQSISNDSRSSTLMSETDDGSRQISNSIISVDDSESTVSEGSNMSSLLSKS